MGERIKVGTLTITWLVDGGESNGTAALFEVEVPPAARVPVPHSHDAYEETIYGLEGALTWTVEGVRTELAPGDALCIRRGEVHGFVNEGGETARALCVVTPAVLTAAFFREMGEVVATAAAAGGSPPVEQIGAVMRRHGLTPAAPAVVLN